MIEKLPCAVVRDLLPSYAEKLTEEETSRLIENHLKNCQRCSELYQNMIVDEPSASEQQRQIDYLKQVRQRNRKKILAAAVFVTAVLLLCVYTGLHFIGWPGDPSQLHCKVLPAEQGSTLELHLFSEGSALSIGRKTVNQAEDIVAVGVRQVLASPFNRNGAAIIEVPLSGINEVYLMGRPVWERGLVIEEQTVNLWEHRTPYIGSFSKVMAAAANLPMPSVNFTSQLDTAAEPYGWTLNFDEALSPAYQTWMHDIMPLMLALVDNMSYISWTWPEMTEEEKIQSRIDVATVNNSLEEWTEQYNQKHKTDWYPMNDVKDYSQSPYTLQQLVNILEKN